MVYGCLSQALPTNFRLVVADFFCFLLVCNALFRNGLAGSLVFVSFSLTIFFLTLINRD